MELDLQEPLLKKIRIGELEPGLRDEVLRLATEMEHEVTITSASRADVLLKLYRAERAKEKRSLKRLKKAEKLILAISTLHLDSTRRAAAQEAKKENKVRMPASAIEAALPLSAALRKAFESIGITDEKAISAVVESVGEMKAMERLDLVQGMKLDPELIKKVMPLKPLVLIELDDSFLQSIETLEAKKEMIDSWSKANTRMPPEEANYNKNPGVLWEEFHVIARILEARPPELPKVTEEKIKPKKAKVRYVSRPMKRTELFASLEELGFKFSRHRNEVVWEHENGGTLTTSYKDEYPSEVIGDILADLHRRFTITREQFAEARQRV